MFQEMKLRRSLVQIMQLMDQSGLNHGTAGNASVRFGDSVLLTPTGIPARELKFWMIVKVAPDGSYVGNYKPTSEWRMHYELLSSRDDVSAAVHCHSRYATTLACSGKEIPSLHYMTAVSGGATIPLAPYATYGTSALSDAIVTSLRGRRACLMANHGQIALGGSLQEALNVALEVETQAAYYYGSLCIGSPVILSDEEMHAVIEQFSSYGQAKS